MGNGIKNIVADDNRNLCEILQNHLLSPIHYRTQELLQSLMMKGRREFAVLGPDRA